MAEEDIISTLPEEILCHILSFLPTKKANATTILSKRWKHIWRSVPNVFIEEVIENQNSNTSFINFVNSVLFSRPTKSTIKSFHFEVIYDDSLECQNLIDWVNFVVHRGVQCLNLNLSLHSWPILPITVLNCKTLVVIKLTFIRVEHCCFTSVLLPSLKTFHLEYVEFPKLRDFMLLLTGCPNLEDLAVYEIYFDSYSMELNCDEWKSFLLSNLTRADIDSYRCYFPVRAVQNVQSLRLYYDQQDYYHNDLIPTFYNLTQLLLFCSDYSKEFILDVLNHCHKLQRLDLAEIEANKGRTRNDDKTNWVFPDVAPQCLLLHLRTCNLLSFLGLHGELMLASYILKFAKVLQIMEIHNS